MSETQASLSGTLAPDVVTLFDAYRPSLTSGSYRLVFQQSIELGDGRETHHYYRDQLFRVQAPRFAIDGDQIEACFPPAAAEGDYARDLPFVLLRGRGLPWERRVDDREERDGRAIPWMALLVLTAAEYEAGGGDGMCRRTTLKQALASPVGTRAAELEDELHEELDMAVRTLDLPGQLLQSICPSREDLPYLAHLRRINADDKPTRGDKAADDEFALLLANRLPGEGRNHVFLVSLEGWGPVLDGEAEFGAQERARLVVLSSWTFVSRHDREHSFGSLAHGLSLDTLGLDHEGLAAEGFVELEYESRHGRRSTWYRGPFSPGPTPARGAACLRDRDHIAYRAAWQLGRSLALASPEFCGGARDFLESCRDQAEAHHRMQRFLEKHGIPLREDGVDRFELSEALVEWLARLLLLSPVPFHYLIPKLELLPSESLRLFHVDDDWLAALANGALATAVHSRADILASERVDYGEALSKLVHRYRLGVQGRPIPARLPGDFLSVAKTGFLLRSRLVSDWPGLEVEVEVEDGVESWGLPALLRLEHLGHGVLLGLCRGRIRSLTLRQPREGLRFGVDEDGGLSLRALDTKELSDQRLGVDEVPRRSGPARVLEIAQLARQCAARLGVERLGSVALALQLILDPELQRVIWADERG